MSGPPDRLVRRRDAVYDRRGRAGVTAAAFSGAEVAVFSFVGVLGITIALFFVVAITARLILGR